MGVDIKCDWCGKRHSKFRKFDTPSGSIVLCVTCRQSVNQRNAEYDNKLYAKLKRVKSALVVERGPNCQQCGRYMKRVHGHHLISIRMGGNNDSSNVILLCADCHKIEHRHGVGS